MINTVSKNIFINKLIQKEKWQQNIVISYINHFNLPSISWQKTNNNKLLCVAELFFHTIFLHNLLKYPNCWTCCPQQKIGKNLYKHFKKIVLCQTGKMHTKALHFKIDLQNIFSLLYFSANVPKLNALKMRCTWFSWFVTYYMKLSGIPYSSGHKNL